MKYAERLHDDAGKNSIAKVANPYLIGSILCSWIALESFINSMLHVFSTLEDFSPHERGLLEEKQVRLEITGDKAGTFVVQNADRYWRLDEKILFLMSKFGKKQFNRGDSLWQKYEQLKDERDKLVHPKKTKPVSISVNDSERAITVIKEIIEFIYEAVMGKSIKW